MIINVIFQFHGIHIIFHLYLGHLVYHHTSKSSNIKSMSCARCPILLIPFLFFINTNPLLCSWLHCPWQLEQHFLYQLHQQLHLSFKDFVSHFGCVMHQYNSNKQFLYSCSLRSLLWSSSCRSKHPSWWCILFFPIELDVPPTPHWWNPLFASNTWLYFHGGAWFKS